MGRKNFIITLFATVLSLSAGCAKSSTEEAGKEDKRFSYENETHAGVRLNYRKAELVRNGGGDKIVVLYLHGGSGQGDDNESQLATMAVADIYEYMESRNFDFVFVVPQAPVGQQWSGEMIGALKALVDKYSAGDYTDSGKRRRVYILGGSMGGYGVWNMLMAYPGYCAGAMPVACNTPRAAAVGYAATRIISVVGGNDPRRSIGEIKSFFEAISAQGAVSRVDVEERWNHRETCEQSFTAERLDFLFSR